VDIEQIWAQFGQQIRIFVAARVPDSHVADELTQELLIKSYQNLNSLQDEERVDAWLFRIARNVINDYYRKMKREKDNRVRGMPDLIESLVQESPQEFVHEDLSRCIQPFVDQLPAKYRRTLTAVDLEGISQKELAEQLGVSHSTIKSQTQRARAQLKQLFNRCCDFTIDARGNVVGYDPKLGQCGCKCDCS
jgi:RNA polymerase sigma-70 factor (ECF subfamily)